MAESRDAPPPTRSFMDDPDIVWKAGRPDYSVVNRKYMAERKMRHQAGSLEKIVEDLVKTWEMESLHKPDYKEWQTIVPEKFQIKTNGGPSFSGADYVKHGSYALLMWDCPFFDNSKETNEGALADFKTAFPGGFAWEVLEVIGGPPKLAFTWRHWVDWEGLYKGVEPTGERFEMTGCCVADVTQDNKIIKVHVIYDPNPIMAKLLGFKSDNKKNSICPFHQSRL